MLQSLIVERSDYNRRFKKLPRNTRVFNSVDQIGEVSWRRLEPPNFPFASYKYLNALEKTSCVGVDTGWQPYYFTCWKDTLLEGAILTYLKTDSYGEYIFDFAWANAYHQNKVSYYPKLLAAIPFTPATGPKILLSTKGSDEVTLCLLEAIETFSKENHLSSVHALFLEKDELPSFEKAHYKIRHSYQFHWQNNDYKNFQSFLSDLKSKRRKEIIRERNQVAKAGLKISVLTGAQLTENHADVMYRFYLDTIHKMGGQAYLNKAFFKDVFENMRDQIVLVLAQNSQDQFVAGALNFNSQEKLFGRYWGCLTDYKALHFELCYYQTIEFAIAQKIKIFEAGAQGEHKFQRGFLPALTYSAHKIADPRFRDAISNFIDDEKKQIDLLFGEYLTHNPFSLEA